jgi:amino acid permease
MTNLFGVCVYAFMCHHSLPQMVTPIRDKSAIFRLFAADYLLIVAFYILVCFTAVFTFANIADLYTLNFGPKAASMSANPITTWVGIQYFLALFPVFTLSSSFPIIAITLRNNLKTLFQLCRRDGGREPYSWPIDRLVFPLLTIIVPISIALGTEDVQFLVGFTGSYAGAAIQYILPASFVLLVRRQLLHSPIVSANPYQSPFHHSGWCVAIFVWSFVCVAFVTANHIVKSMEGAHLQNSTSDNQ